MKNVRVGGRSPQTPDRFRGLDNEELIMTIATVGSGQESSGVITLNSASPGLVFYQNGVGSQTFIKDDIGLPLLNDPVRIAETVRRNEVDGTFHSVGWTATLISDVTMYVLLAIFIAVLALGLVVVPDESFMLDDPISFARGE
jgi:hypothetical protein